jgi:hypothetical protein
MMENREKENPSKVGQPEQFRQAHEMNEIRCRGVAAW